MSGLAHTPEERLELEKNTVRGLFGQLKNRLPGEVDRRAFKARKAPRSDSFWVGLREALVAARSNLDPNDYDTYFEWLRAQINASRHFQEFPAPVAALDGLFDTQPISAEAEIHWAVARLAGVAEQIDGLCRLALALDNSVAAGGAQIAVQAMEVFEEHLGASLWTYELGLALRQVAEGLEAQKAYSEAVRAPIRRAPYSFIVSYASIRNEPRTTWPRFRDSVADRVSKLAFNDDAKTLVRYRLLGDNIETSDDALAVLRGIQSFPAMDQYRTLIRVAEWSLEHQECSALRQAMQTHLPKLLSIKDEIVSHPVV